MSSTEERPEALEQIGRFFDEVLAPMAQAMVATGHTPFPAGPDPSLGSYWVERQERSLSPAEFLAPSCLDPNDLAQRLAQYWARAGRDDLAALAPRFAELAQAARGHEAPDEEVSPFVYTMF